MGIVKALDPWMERRQLLLKPGAGRIERGQMIDHFSDSKNRHEQVLMLRVRRQMLSAGRIGRVPGDPCAGCGHAPIEVGKREDRRPCYGIDCRACTVRRSHLLVNGRVAVTAAPQGYRRRDRAREKRLGFLSGATPEAVVRSLVSVPGVRSSAWRDE